MNELVPLFARFKLDVDAYHRMAEVGILPPDARVELIDGEIVEMAPIGSDHAATVASLNARLVRAFGEQAIIWPQNLLRLNARNEPVSDFVVLRPRADAYRSKPLPGAADALLVIEVADSSLGYDRTVKLRFYATAGVPEIWIVDLRRRVVHVHRDRQGDAYQSVTAHEPGDVVVPQLAPDVPITLDRVFD